MTKEQYMDQLKKYLHRLPKQEYEDAVDYFEEYFGEADEDGQQKLMKELGTPKEAARDLISNLLDKKLDETSAISKPVQKGTLKVALLAVCAAPVAIPLLIVLFAVLASAAVCLFCAYLCVFILALCAFLIGGKLFVRGIVAISFSIPGSFILLGLGLLGIGLSILLCILGIYLCKWTCILFARTAQLIINRKRG